MQRSRAFVDPTEGDDATSTEPRIVCNGIFTPFRGPFPLALSYSFPTLSRCRIDEHLVSREIFLLLLPPPVSSFVAIISKEIATILSSLPLSIESYQSE